MCRNSKTTQMIFAIISPLLIIFLTLDTTSSTASPGNFAGQTGIISAQYAPTEIWIPQTSGTSNYLADADCIDQDHVWVAGFNATLLKTSDHGEHWIYVAIGVDPAKGFSALHFLD